MCVAQVYLTFRWAIVRLERVKPWGRDIGNGWKGILRRGGLSVLGPLSSPPALAVGVR